VKRTATAQDRRRRRRLTRLSLLDRFISSLSASAALRRGIRLADQGRRAPAFALFARAARAGVVQAEYRIGRCYLEGSGVPASRNDSLHWLNRAAAQGHIDAQWLLAALHIHEAGAREGWEDIADGSSAATLFSAGQVWRPDFVAAEKWARQAAEHGSADGQAVLAYILSSGPESMRTSRRRTDGTSGQQTQAVPKDH